MGVSGSLNFVTNLIILDRDGVINVDSDAFIKSPEEWQPIPGSLAAIAALQQQGYTVAVATNQSGLARGLFTETTLHHIHTKFQDALVQHGGQPVTIVYCPHGPENSCACRKPSPGLIHELLTRYQAQAADTWVVGDAVRDLEAATRAGAKPILVLTGKGVQTQQQLQKPILPIYPDLAGVTTALLAGKL